MSPPIPPTPAANALIFRSTLRLVVGFVVSFPDMGLAPTSHLEGGLFIGYGHYYYRLYTRANNTNNANTQKDDHEAGQRPHHVLLDQSIDHNPR